MWRRAILKESYAELCRLKHKEKMLPLTTNDLLALLIVLVTALCLGIVYWLFGDPKNGNFRLPATTEPIDSLLQRSAEEGRPVLLNLGVGFSQHPEIAGILGLDLQRMLVSRSLTANRPSYVGSGDGVLALVSQQISRGLYRDALMPEYFDADQAGLQALGPIANLAGLLSLVPENNPAGLLLYGNITPEYLLTLDQNSSAASLGVVGASTATAQASLWLHADHSAIGEDVFAPISAKNLEKSSLTGPKVADILRVLICIALLAAAILKVMGEF